MDKDPWDYELKVLVFGRYTTTTTSPQMGLNLTVKLCQVHQDKYRLQVWTSSALYISSRDDPFIYSFIPPKPPWIDSSGTVQRHIDAIDRWRLLSVSEPVPHCSLSRVRELTTFFMSLYKETHVTQMSSSPRWTIVATIESMDRRPGRYWARHWKGAYSYKRYFSANWNIGIKNSRYLV